VDSVYSINIERAVLSSILFNPDEFEIAKKIVKAEDFYFPAHKKIFEAMNVLNAELMPIDEEFIRKKINNQNIDDNVLIEILSCNPITNIEAYLKDIKDNSIKRKLNVFATDIKKMVDSDDSSPSKIFSDIEEYLKKLTSSHKYDFLKPVALSNVIEEETKYICKKFIPFPQYSVGLIAARGGVGKTFAILTEADEYIEEQLIETGEIREVLIIATEDRAGKLKARANRLKLKHQNQIHISSIYSFDVLERDPKTQNWRTTEDFYKFKNSSVNYGLIIIDPMLSFYSGKENDNGDAKKFMMPFVRLADERNQNIIFLHHADKEGKGSRGAGAFADATRLTYYVTKETIKNDDGKFEEVKNSRKLRFEVQKENDDISSIKRLDPITTVGVIGSFLLDVFPIKVEIQNFEEKKDETKSKKDGQAPNLINKDEEDNLSKNNIEEFEDMVKGLNFFG
jgi:replicative DNA helicase